MACIIPATALATSHICLCSGTVGRLRTSKLTSAGFSEVLWWTSEKYVWKFSEVCVCCYSLGFTQNHANLQTSQKSCAGFSEVCRPTSQKLAADFWEVWWWSAEGNISNHIDGNRCFAEKSKITKNCAELRRRFFHLLLLETARINIIII